MEGKREDPLRVIDRCRSVLRRQGTAVLSLVVAEAVVASLLIGGSELDSDSLLLSLLAFAAMASALGLFVIKRTSDNIGWWEITPEDLLLHAEEVHRFSFVDTKAAFVQKAGPEYRGLWLRRRNARRLFVPLDALPKEASTELLQKLRDMGVPVRTRDVITGKWQVEEAVGRAPD